MECGMTEAEEEFMYVMTRFQVAVKAWQAEQFPTSTLPSRFNHLKSEMRELEKCVGNIIWAVTTGQPEDYRRRRVQEIGEELADMFLLMLAIASGEDINMGVEVVKKFAINQDRNWGKPNAEGFVEHIRSE
jgi:NTP pyrophosphatase (non-canonical NTP hydrolase)